MSLPLNVSLEAHLRSSLTSIQDHLPAQLGNELKSYLSVEQNYIPYTVLSKISVYARSEAFASCKLNKTDYTMISLLAGTTTSPERHFAPVEPADSANPNSDRKAITALLNALLSIIGAGVAMFLASERLLWSIEWRVLLALGTSITVAVSEAILCLLWQTQKSGKTPGLRKNSILVPNAKKRDPAIMDPSGSQEAPLTDGLRLRRIAS